MAVNRSNTSIFVSGRVCLTPGLFILVDIREGKRVSDIRIRFSIYLDVWIHKIVQSFIVLFGAEFQVAANCELNPIHIVGAKEILLLLLVLPCFRDIHREPAALMAVELRPAVISGNLARVLTFGDGEANLES